AVRRIITHTVGEHGSQVVSGIMHFKITGYKRD
ncbi:unnamed protein product, partial [marine sediment metagenome]